VGLFVSDTDTEALLATLDYVDETGRALSRTAAVVRAGGWYPNAPGGQIGPRWINADFWVGKVQVQRVLAAPLVSGGRLPGTVTGSQAVFNDVWVKMAAIGLGLGETLQVSAEFNDQETSALLLRLPGVVPGHPTPWDELVVQRIIARPISGRVATDTIYLNWAVNWSLVTVCRLVPGPRTVEYEPVPATQTNEDPVRGGDIRLR